MHEKLFIIRLKTIIERKNLIPNHQFGFRSNHSTIDQVHRITDVIEKTIEEKKIGSTIFLDVAQACDKVWHIGLIHKIKECSPKQRVEMVEPYLKNRFFRIKQEDQYSELRNQMQGSHKAVCNFIIIN